MHTLENLAPPSAVETLLGPMRACNFFVRQRVGSQLTRPDGVRTPSRRPQMLLTSTQDTANRLVELEVFVDKFRLVIRRPRTHRHRPTAASYHTVFVAGGALLQQGI